MMDSRNSPQNHDFWPLHLGRTSCFQRLPRYMGTLKKLGIRDHQAGPSAAKYPGRWLQSRTFRMGVLPPPEKYVKDVFKSGAPANESTSCFVSFLNPGQHSLLRTPSLLSGIGIIWSFHGVQVKLIWMGLKQNLEVAQLLFRLLLWPFPAQKP